MYTMSGLSPLAMIVIGFLLAFGGFAILFLIVIKVLETGFLLNFLSYGASFMGLLLGFVGVTQYVAGNHRER